MTFSVHLNDPHALSLPQRWSRSHPSCGNTAHGLGLAPLWLSTQNFQGIVHDIEVLSKRGHVETLANMKSYVKEQHGLSVTRSIISQCAAQGRVRTKSDEIKADFHCAHAGTAGEVGHIASPRGLLSGASWFSQTKRQSAVYYWAQALSLAAQRIPMGSHVYAADGRVRWGVFICGPGCHHHTES